jgi:hypothetical protein
MFEETCNNGLYLCLSRVYLLNVSLAEPFCQAGIRNTATPREATSETMTVNEMLTQALLQAPDKEHRQKHHDCGKGAGDNRPATTLCHLHSFFR